jgi:hypothetical protein
LSNAFGTLKQVTKAVKELSELLPRWGIQGDSHGLSDCITVGLIPKRVVQLGIVVLWQHLVMPKQTEEENKVFAFDEGWRVLRYPFTRK